VDIPPPLPPNRGEMGNKCFGKPGGGEVSGNRRDPSDAASIIATYSGSTLTLLLLQCSCGERLDEEEGVAEDAMICTAYSPGKANYLNTCGRP
jgi:hypothetical protein